MEVFVYGTLKEGYGNHDWYLKGQPCKGVATVKDHTLLDIGAFPGMIPEEGSEVHGEVYEVDEDTLYKMDRLEGFDPYNPEGSLYVRTKVTLADGREVSTYLWNRDTDRYEEIGAVWP